MSSNKDADTKTDLNHVEYDAPLSIQEPSSAWRHSQSYKGSTSKKLKPSDVPGADLTGKWVLISGANSGIGREAALQFAAWGASIVLACREPPPTSQEPHPATAADEVRARAREAGHADSTIEWWEVDMAKLSTVDALAERWLATGRALDVLCNNAGIGSSPGGDKVMLTADGFEIIHQVNFLSHVLLTLRLLPSLAKAPQPRIVCTTSCFHYYGRFGLRYFNGSPDGATKLKGVSFYQNNKLWFQTWLTELQHRLLQHDSLRHITINGIHPGYVNSGIWNLNSHAPVEQFVVKVLAWFLAIDSYQGSLAITHCATSPEAGPDPKVQGVGDELGKGGGRYFNRVWEDEPMPHTRDRDCRLRVWRKVNDELKLQDKGLLDTLGLYATDL